MSMAVSPAGNGNGNGNDNGTGRGHRRPHDGGRGLRARVALARGMEFVDGRVALHTVQDYALAQNKCVKLSSRGGKHRQIVCTSAGCSFFVQMYQHRSASNTAWYVSSLNIQHSDDCASRAKPTRRQLLEMESFQSAVRRAPEASAAVLASHLAAQSPFPMQINLRTIYRAKDAMRSTLADQQAQQYAQIPSLLRGFAAMNPGSYATHDVDLVQHRFRRAFVACGTFTRALAIGSNQQILGFHCVASTSATGGMHLYLLGKDGDMQTVVLAAAITMEPVDQDTLCWFFQCATTAGVVPSTAVNPTAVPRRACPCPVLCAFNPELLALENELPGVTFRYCTQHLIESELAPWGSVNAHHHALVWGLQAADSEDEFEKRLQWIRTCCGVPVESVLRQLPMERWAVAGNLGKTALYGWRSRHFETEESSTSHHAIASSFKQKPSALMPERLLHSAPFQFVHDAMTTFMGDVYAHSTKYKEWAEMGLKITPHAQRLYDQQFQLVGAYTVTRASASLAFVSHVNNTSSPRRRVDLEANTCSCSFMDQYRIPCRHMVAVLIFCQQMESVLMRFAHVYRVECYGEAYNDEMVEMPLDTRPLPDDPKCLPPLAPMTRRPHGRTTSRTAHDSDGDGDADEDGDNGEEATASEDVSPCHAPAKRARSSNGDAVDAVVTENALPTAPSLGAVRRKHRCGVCKDAGHNARSCPSRVLVPTSGALPFHSNGSNVLAPSSPGALVTPSASAAVSRYLPNGM